MNKAELINQIIEDTNYSRGEISEIINAALNCMENALYNHDKVSLMGFGTFTVTVREPRVAINPKTLEKVNVGKRARVKFKAGKELVAAVNREV